MLEYAKIILIFSTISDYYYFQINKPVFISILFDCPCFKLTRLVLVFTIMQIGFRSKKSMTERNTHQ